MTGKSRTSHTDRMGEFLARTFTRDGPRSVIENLSFLPGAFVITKDGEVVEFNDEFIRLVGYPRDQLYGMSALDLVREEDRDDLMRRLQENITDSYQLRLRTRSGQTKYILVHPRLFQCAGRTYRVAEFIDNTGYVNLYKRHIDNLKKIVHALVIAIEQKDHYTTGHMTRTAFMAGEIGRVMALDEHLLETIVLGGSIHDIGKISIPNDTLSKPDKLTADEWELIKQHPENGYKIVEDLDLEQPVKDIVLLHHERQDGAGYPYGYDADRIPLVVSIVTVADCLDAITGLRPYRNPYSFEQAIEIMAGERGKYLDEPFRVARRLVASGELRQRLFKADSFS